MNQTQNYARQSGLYIYNDWQLKPTEYIHFTCEGIRNELNLCKKAITNTRSEFLKSFKIDGKETLTRRIL